MNASRAKVLASEPLSLRTITTCCAVNTASDARRRIRGSKLQTPI